MTYEPCESKLRSVVRLSMHLYPGNWLAIGRAVVYYAWAAPANLVEELHVGTVLPKMCY